MAEKQAVLEKNDRFSNPASEASVKRAAKALRENGMEVHVVGTVKEARQKVLEIIPSNVGVMNMTSVTLDSIGVTKDILESGRFNPIRKTLMEMPESENIEKKKLGSAPEWVIGSVHAVTEDGHVLIASATGSQLAAYVYGAAHAVWVVGTQKIVKNTEEGMKRIYEYTFPLEDERARKAYGVGSGVNKILIVNKEVAAGRITVILVKEKLGF